ncbi:MAG: hypothetical protein LBF88_01760 [Planctomycetaceae bacterium]|nr:hypothetical protein [Planctomycetaceae bacterium]
MGDFLVNLEHWAIFNSILFSKTARTIRSRQPKRLYHRPYRPSNLSMFNE